MGIAKLIAIEGFDGSGKSTLAHLLRRALLDLGHDVAIVKAFRNVWVPDRIMTEVATGLLPDPVAAELRLHRYAMQRNAKIRPLLDANVHVLSDRGPASAIWRLEQQRREDLVPQVTETMKDVDLHVVLHCAAERCLGRILDERPITQVETGFVACEDDAQTQAAFQRCHTRYYELLNEILHEQHTLAIDANRPAPQVVSDCVEGLLPRLNGNSGHDGERRDACHDGLAAEVREARSFRYKAAARADLPMSVLQNSSEIAQREWLNGLDAGMIEGTLASVELLTRSERGHVRETAVECLNRLGICLDFPEVLRLLSDADKDVRNAASAMAARMPPAAVERLVIMLSAKPGPELASLIAGVQQTATRNEDREVVRSVARRFPFTRAQIARACRRKKDVDPDLTAMLLADEQARPVLLTNLTEGSTHLLGFDELRAACERELNDRAWGTITALLAMAAAKRTGELLRRGSLLYHDDHQVAKAAVESWIGSGLMEWLPDRFRRHPDYAIRRCITLAGAPHESADSPRASPIDGVFFSTRPGRDGVKKAARESVGGFVDRLLRRGFRRILVLTTVAEDLRHYGTDLVSLYEGLAGGQIDVRRFPIEPFGIPLDRRGSEDHSGISHAGNWLLDRNSQPALIHCGGARGRTGLMLGCLLRRGGASTERALRSVHRAGHIRKDGQAQFVDNHA